ncbi:MAG: hypothetical protein AB7I36_08365 [Rhodospirillaceae bacterium]
MRQLKIAHVKALAAGLNGMKPEDLEGLLLTEGHVVVRTAALIVASHHTGATPERLAGLFDMDVDQCRRAMTIARNSWLARSENFCALTDGLHLAVVRLVAAWKREAWMNAWRAAQPRTKVERGPYRRDPFTTKPNPFAKAPMSAWRAWDAEDTALALAAE